MTWPLLAFATGGLLVWLDYGMPGGVGAGIVVGLVVLSAVFMAALEKR